MTRGRCDIWIPMTMPFIMLADILPLSPMTVTGCVKDRTIKVKIKQMRRFFMLRNLSRGRIVVWQVSKGLEKKDERERKRVVIYRKLIGELWPAVHFIQTSEPYIQRRISSKARHLPKLMRC